MVRMPAGPIKQVGETHIQVQLHTDVVVTVNVSVLGEQ
jgi:large subunit ribosomal protein L9